MQQLIDAQRLALAAREDTAALDLARQFATIADAVELELTGLTAAIEAAGSPVTLTWLYRNALYKKLMAGAGAAYVAYSRQAISAIEGQHAAALDYGLRDAAELLTLAGKASTPLGKRAQNGLLVGMRKRLRALRLPTSILQLAGRAISGTLVKAVSSRPVGEAVKPAGLITKIREGLGAILINVLRAQRQESTTAYRAVTTAQFAATLGVSGWQWAAELERSPAPCAVCVAMHGEVFPAETPFGGHIGCRCLAIPVITGVGPAIAELGPTWLARQDEARQVAVLGRSKQRYYRSGHLKLAQLVEVADHPIYGLTRYERSLKALGLDYRTATTPAVTTQATP